MADSYAASSLEDEIDQPPGTFKSIRSQATRSWIVVLGWLTIIPPGDETYEQGKRFIALDPIPSSDPNEPLVRYH